MAGITTQTESIFENMSLKTNLPANFGLSQSHLAQTLWIYRQLFVRRFEAYAASILETFAVVRNLVTVVPEMFDASEVLPDVERSLALDSGSCLEYVQKAFDEFVRASQEQLVASLLDRQKASFQSRSVIRTISQHLSNQFEGLAGLHQQRLGELEAVEVLQSRIKETVANLPSTTMQPEALTPLIDYEDDEAMPAEAVVDTPEVQDEAEEEGMVMATPKTSTVVQEVSQKIQPVTRHFRADATSLTAILEQKSAAPAWSMSATQLQIFLRSELILKQIKHQLPSSFGVLLIDKASTKRKRTAVIMKAVQPRPGQPAAAAANQRGGGRGGFGGFGARAAARVADGLAAEPVVVEEVLADPQPADGGFRFGDPLAAPGAFAPQPAAGWGPAAVNFGQGFGNAANRQGAANAPTATFHLVELDLLTGDVQLLHDLPFSPDYLTHAGSSLGVASKSLKSIKVFKGNNEIYSSAAELHQQGFGAAPGAITTSMNQFVLHQDAIFFVTPTNELVKYVVDKDSSFQVVIGTSRIKGICFWHSYLATVDDTSHMTFYSTKNLTLVKKCAIPSTTKTANKDAKVSCVYYSCISDNQVLITLSKVNKAGVGTQVTSINLHTVSKTLSGNVGAEPWEAVDPNSHTAALNLESFFEFPHENAASHFSNSLFFSIKGVRHLGLMVGLSAVLAFFCIEHHKIRHRGSVKILDDANLPGMPRYGDTVVLTTLDESLVISRALKQNLIFLVPELYL